MLADDDVIISDQARQNADRDDNRQGRIPGGQKSRPDDISLAGAPVSIEQGRCASPTDISRAVAASGIYIAGRCSCVLREGLLDVGIVRLWNRVSSKRQ